MPTKASRSGGTTFELGRAHELGEAEGEVERLARVQPRIAERHVAGGKLFLEDGFGAAEALGHVLARELEVDAPRPDPLGAARGEEALDLVHDRVEAAGLHARIRLEDVCVHRVAGPHDGMLGLPNGAKERRQELEDVLRPHPRNEGQPAGHPRGVEPFADLDQLVGGRRGPDLHAQRVVHAGEELDVGAVELPRALPDPEHVGRAVVPVPGGRVAAGERLLVVEHEPFVARPDVNLMELLLGDDVDPARRHEEKRALDLGGEPLVPAALDGRGDELLVPLVHPQEVGEAALREGADEVERRRGVVVGRDHALRIRGASLRRGSVVVDHVAPERWDLPVSAGLGRRRPRLGVLTCDPPDLHDRQGGAVGEHSRHLQEDLQLLADVDRRDVVERLGAVARLEEEGSAGGHLGERRTKLARLAGEDERRHGREFSAHGLGPLLARPLGLVERGIRAPGRRRPDRTCDSHCSSV